MTTKDEKRIKTLQRLIKDVNRSDWYELVRELRNLENKQVQEAERPKKRRLKAFFTPLRASIVHGTFNSNLSNI